MRAFESYHPFVLLIYFLSVLLISMFVSNPLLQASAFFGGCLFRLLLRRRRGIAGNAGFFLLLFLTVALTNPLFSHNGMTPLFYLNGNPITLEAFAYGVSIAVMIIGVMLWCQCYSEVMTNDKFLYLFGKAIPKLSLLLSMSLRLLPLFKRQMRQVSQAQRAMGLYSSRNFMDQIRSAMRVFMAMLSWAVENAMETSSSMKARGYGMKNRTHFSLFPFYSRDGVLLTVCLLLSGLTVAGAAAGATVFDYYPEIHKLNWSPYAVTVYAAFGILSFLPSIIEAKEALVWKYYRSKI